MRTRRPHTHVEGSSENTRRTYHTALLYWGAWYRALLGFTVSVRPTHIDIQLRLHSAAICEQERDQRRDLQRPYEGKHSSR
jgi:hypothetical protein